MDEEDDFMVETLLKGARQNVRFAIETVAGNATTKVTSIVHDIVLSHIRDAFDDAVDEAVRDAMRQAM